MTSTASLLADWLPITGTPQSHFPRVLCDARLEEVFEATDCQAVDEEVSHDVEGEEGDRYPIKVGMEWSRVDGVLVYEGMHDGVDSQRQDRQTVDNSSKYHRHDALPPQCASFIFLDALCSFVYQDNGSHYSDNVRG